MKKLLLVINPRAGMMRANRFLPDIVCLFNSYGYENIVYSTRAPGDGVTICKEKAPEVDLVVCIGGDGTFNEIIAGMMESGAGKPIGYIPAGSTNDLAKSMKLSRNIMKAAKDIMLGSPRALDVGSFNGRYFSYVASCGAFTKASYSTPQLNKNILGRTAYLLEGINELPELKPVRLRVETADETYEDDYIFAAVSNSTSVAGLLTLDSKLVDLNDGKFEIMLIKSPATPVQLMDIVHALNIRNYKNPMIRFFSTDHAVIHSPKSVDWTLDGEYMKGQQTIDFRNVHSAIHLILNNKSTHRVRPSREPLQSNQ